jgi:hypothetical protein
LLISLVNSDLTLVLSFVSKFVAFRDRSLNDVDEDCGLSREPPPIEATSFPRFQRINAR